MRIYTEVPDGVAAAPGVIVIIHGPGLDGFIEDRVAALARAGYAAAAPDLFHRQPTEGGAPTDFAGIMARIGKLRDGEILEDIDAAVAHLRALERPRVTGLAVIGFCMGGRISYLAAGARPGTWRAAGVFYGGHIMKAWGDGPTPLELTPRIDCPVIGCFGEDDTNPSPADVDRIDAELTAHGKPHELHRYAGAGHAFLNATSAERYRPAQAADAWQKLLAFLDRHLKA